MSRKKCICFSINEYYPDIFHAHQRSISVKISEIIKKNYEEGISLEYFRTDVPIDLYIKFLITLLFSIDVSPILRQ
jgi:hypothetical protein